MSKRTQNSIINIKYGLINQIVTMLFNFVNRKIFIIILGTEYLGVTGLYNNILTVLSLLDLGISTVLIYSFYQPLAEMNERKISALMRFYGDLYKFIAVITGIFGVSVLPFLKYLVKLNEDIPHLELYFILFLLNVMLQYLAIYRSSLLTANQSGYIITKYNIFLTVIRVVLQSVFLYVTHDFFIYLLIQIGITLLNNTLITFKTYRLFPYAKNTPLYLNKEEKQSLFVNIKSLFVFKASNIFLDYICNILISIMLGTIWVGLYSNYLLITTQLGMAIATLFNNVNASLGNLIVLGSKEKIYHVYEELQCAGYILCGVCCTCVYVLINDFIKIWLGSEYILSGYVVIAVCINFYVTCVLQPIWSFREATGLYLRTRNIMFTAAVLNLVLSILLGKFFGLAGIIIATPLAKICTFFWFEANLLHREYFGQKPARYYTKTALNLLLIIIQCFLLRSCTSFLQVTGLFTWLLKAVICVFGSGICVFLFYFKTDMFQLLLHRMITIDKKILKIGLKHIS